MNFSSLQFLGNPFPHNRTFLPLLLMAILSTCIKDISVLTWELKDRLVKSLKESAVLLKNLTFVEPVVVSVTPVVPGVLALELTIVQPPQSVANPIPLHLPTVLLVVLSLMVKPVPLKPTLKLVKSMVVTLPLDNVVTPVPAVLLLPIVSNTPVPRMRIILMDVNLHQPPSNPLLDLVILLSVKTMSGSRSPMEMQHPVLVILVQLVNVKSSIILTNVYLMVPSLLIPSLSPMLKNFVIPDNVFLQPVIKPMQSHVNPVLVTLFLV
jgi:hypothetical protein